MELPNGGYGIGWPLDATAETEVMVRSLRLEARAAYEQKDFEAAAGAFEALLESVPSDFEAQAVLGLMAAADNANEEAASLLTRALALKPAHIGLHIVLLDVLSRAKSSETAQASVALVEKYLPLCEVAGASPQKGVKRALWAYALLQRFEEAYACIDRAIAMFPSDENLYAVSLQQLRLLGGSDPNMAGPSVAGTGLNAKGPGDRGPAMRAIAECRWDDALQELDTLITANPKEPVYVRLVADTLTEMGLLKEAHARYVMASTMYGGEDAATHIGLIANLTKQGNSRMALDALEIYVNRCNNHALSDRDHDPTGALLECEAMLGAARQVDRVRFIVNGTRRHWGRASADTLAGLLERVLEREVEMLTADAARYAEHGRYEDALRVHGQVMALRPNDYDTMVAAAGLAMQMRDDGRAREFYWRAIGLEPLRQVAYVALADVLRRQRRGDDMARLCGAYIETMAASSAAVGSLLSFAHGATWAFEELGAETDFRRLCEVAAAAFPLERAAWEKLAAKVGVGVLVRAGSRAFDSMDFATAHAKATAALALNPEDFCARFWLCLALAGQEDLTAAVAAFTAIEGRSGEFVACLSDCRESKSQEAMLLVSRLLRRVHNQREVGRIAAGPSVGAVPGALPPGHVPRYGTNGRKARSPGSGSRAGSRAGSQAASPLSSVRPSRQSSGGVV